jgi:hypothetical protein
MEHRSQSILPCLAGREACALSTGTWLWKRPSEKDSCPYYLARKVVGIQVEGMENDRRVETFLSTDGSMVRLMKKPGIVACNHLLHPTNYENLFLTKALDEPLFQRRVHPGEMSIMTYVNIQDEFLYGVLTDYIKEEFRTLVWRSCQRDLERRAQAYASLAAEQRATLDGETTSLGNGWFATASGEAWYKYQCRETKVLATDLPICYSALPVILSTEDRKRYIHDRKIEAPPSSTAVASKEPTDAEILTGLPTQFFVEPHTHRLTTVGIPTPCSINFAPLYRNNRGKWIMAMPELRLANRPRDVDYRIKEDIRNAPKFDWEAGGLYPPEAVREMEEYTHAPRRKEELAFRMAEQARRHAPGSSNAYLTLHDAFPQVDVNFDALSQIWLFLARWGNIAAILLSLAFAARLMTWIAGVLVRCVSLHNTFGFGKRMWMAVLPSCLFMIQAASPFSSMRPPDKKPGEEKKKEKDGPDKKKRSVFGSARGNAALTAASAPPAGFVEPMQLDQPPPLPREQDQAGCYEHFPAPSFNPGVDSQALHHRMETLRLEGVEGDPELLRQ